MESLCSKTKTQGCKTRTIVPHHSTKENSVLRVLDNFNWRTGALWYYFSVYRCAILYWFVKWRENICFCNSTCATRIRHVFPESRYWIFTFPSISMFIKTATWNTGWTAHLRAASTASVLLNDAMFNLRTSTFILALIWDLWLLVIDNNVSINM